MGMSEVLRYKVGPPVMVVTTTAGVQLLARLGGDTNNTTPWSLLGDTFSWTVVTVILFWALLSLWVPGKEFKGPQTTFGYTPLYKANGFQFLWVSLAAFLTFVYFNQNFPLDLYNNFHNILSSCNVLAFVLCIYLLVKGKMWPESSEILPPKPLMYEFYRGMELHPRILGVDVKQLTNCRFGLLAWELLVVTFFLAGWQRNGFSLAHLVSVILQTIYLAKFYWWETGYFNTLDIILDRAGYYICWGCLVFVPSLYTFSSYYLVANPPLVSASGSVLILMLGVVAITLNYRVDWEKEHFRAHNGNCILWGRPATYVETKYTTNTGVKRSKLLTSGFWGVARHLNYTFELTLALAWCLPGLGYGILPFIYFIFLLILLVHRVFRDEEKCSAKYGDAWDKYCKEVPYRMIPGIF
ncbi:hypothetical protein Pmani_026653 [Petrolisthes manimaculis]|uniref:7-dehydrocholesterol reductase n=1 Tax=Petrolisthes manimaculis TaxID=1843537 RepID=A0AAE1P5B6_9EUCA|nr:hypothetical protein Pmani_026653 [Petrolisthes manimaculis]